MTTPGEFQRPPARLAPSPSKAVVAFFALVIRHVVITMNTRRALNGRSIAQPLGLPSQYLPGRRLWHLRAPAVGALTIPPQHRDCRRTAPAHARISAKREAADRTRPAVTGRFVFGE